MDFGIKTKIKKMDIFSALEDDEIDELLEILHSVSLNEGDKLFSQGDSSDNIYIVTKGILNIVHYKEGYGELMVNRIIEGELVGEMGVITGLPRTMSVYASSKVELLSLNKILFHEFIQSHVSIALKVLNLVSTRYASSLNYLSHDNAVCVSLLSANEDIIINRLIELVEPLVDVGSEIEFYRHLPSSDISKIKLTVKKHKFIFFLIDSKDNEWNSTCLALSNIVYVIGDGGKRAYISDKVKNLLSRQHSKHLKTRLILLHSDLRNIQRTEEWLMLDKFDNHFHVSTSDFESVKRLMRMIMGRSYGVVLGGGGIRGWAHIGAIKALLDSGFHIDSVGGTSAGCYMAMNYCLAHNYQEFESLCHEGIGSISEVAKLTSFRWPFISFSNSAKGTAILKCLYSEKKLEDAHLFGFGLSVNLTRSIEKVHRTGKIWEIVRSSTAVPGLIPAMVKYGELYTDGGILNNIPINHMRNYLGSDATVIAIDVSNMLDFEKNKYRFPPNPSFIKTLLSKFKLIKNPYVFPRFTEFMFSAILVGSSYRIKKSISLADYYVAPDLSGFSMLHASKQDKEKLFQIGYDSMLKALDNGKLKRES